jgi:subtilisin family serine protease
MSRLQAETGPMLRPTPTVRNRFVHSSEHLARSAIRPSLHWPRGKGEGSRAESPFDVVRLTPLMARTAGSAALTIAVIDGPVDLAHRDLASEHISVVPGRLPGTCATASDVACSHGTSVAGILSSRRDSATPGICPDCTVLLLPIFAGGADMPIASPEDLAAGITDAVSAHVQIVNLSAAVMWPTPAGERALTEALDRAARAGVVVVAAAGNEGTLGSSAITRHPWVIPVAACDLHGRPMMSSTMGSSIGRRGLRAPGDGILGPGPGGTSAMFSGTSAAAPFVTGTIALLWSEFPQAAGTEIRRVVTSAAGGLRKTVVPPLLQAWAAYSQMAEMASAHDREV